MGKRKTTEEVIRDFKKVHGDRYDYSKVEYNGVHKKVEIVCPNHGSFWKSPMNHKKGQGCKECKSEENRAIGITKRYKEFIGMAHNTHGTIYDYSKVKYVNAYKKVEIVCPIHGSFWQQPVNHIHGKGRGCGCPKCAIDTRASDRKNKSSNIKERAYHKHGFKYDYSKSFYIGAHSKIEIICPEHGPFWQTADSHLNSGLGCPKCSLSGPSNQELKIAEFLSTIINCSIIKNTRSVIPPYELDIYIPDHNLAIEFNGLYWHSTACKRDHKYHLRKTQMCEEKGIRLIHIYEDEWNEKPCIIKSMLSYKVHGENFKIYNARQCNVVCLNTGKYKSFLEEFHILGPTSGSSIRLGLMYKNEIVATMGFVKISGNVYNLNRYATKGSVRGGFSKLLSYFKKNYEWNEIISYADRRFSRGALYEMNGFECEHISNPSFDYVKQFNRYNRQQFMKHKLAAKFPDTYDPSLTEWENMELQGYYQIWNCGYIKYVMEA